MANLDNSQMNDVCYLLDVVANRLLEKAPDDSYSWPRTDVEESLSDIIAAIRAHGSVMSGIEIKRSVLTRWASKGL